MVSFFPFKERAFPFFPVTSRLRTWTPVTMRRSRRPHPPSIWSTKDKEGGIWIYYEYARVPPAGWLQKLNAGWSTFCSFFWFGRRVGEQQTQGPLGIEHHVSEGVTCLVSSYHVLTQSLEKKEMTGALVLIINSWRKKGTEQRRWAANTKFPVLSQRLRESSPKCLKPPVITWLRSPREPGRIWLEKNREAHDWGDCFAAKTLATPRNLGSM